MNGFDFVERILGQTNNDVWPLIEAAGGCETEWLEFKAASTPKNESYAKSENKWDYRWDVSKALLGFANHIGGAVILGVKETEIPDQPVKPVSLDCSGFKGDRDGFMRDVIHDQLISPKTGWKTGTAGELACEGLRDVVTPRWGHLFGQPVVVMMVRPRLEKGGWLRVSRKSSGKETYIVPCRAMGHLGRTNHFSEEAIAESWGSRAIDSLELDHGYQRFLEQWTSAKKKSDEETNAVIVRYLTSLPNRTESREELSGSNDTCASEHQFVPTEAEDYDRTPGDGRSRRAMPQPVQELLTSRPRTVLLGEPGAGKSTNFLISALRLSRDWAAGQPWGLIVELNEFSELGLRATILRKLEPLHWVDIEYRLAKGELILFLDALNECPVRLYVECCQDIAAMLKLYPDARIHITSRVTHNPSQFQMPSYRVRPMNRPQQEKFLEIYLGSSDRANEVLSHLHQQPGAEHFASNPFLLRIIAEIAHDPREPLPTGMASLYRRFLEKWFVREKDKDALSGSPELWPYNRFVESLASLAYRMRGAGFVSCPIEFARQSIGPVIGTDHLAKFIDQMTHGLLLRKDANDEYLHFSHETIQDYFAAEYLAKHPEVLHETLDQIVSAENASGWFFSLVFAFELIERPTKALIEAAWALEPMLVAVSLRDDAQLLRLPLHPHDDIWLRGALRAIRGEDATAEMRELAYISRLPPKYPLPKTLTNPLQSAAFWYAGKSHANGELRLNRLKKFLLDRNSLWIEAMPYLVNAEADWTVSMSRAQREIAGVGPGTLAGNSKNLGDCTVTELCTLLRYKKIRKEEFVKVWQGVLEQGDDSHQESDLLAIIRTAREFKNGALRINLRELPQQYKSLLDQLGLHWKLSLRLLNFLVREGFVSPDSLRDDPGRIDNIVERLSAMNMYRFLRGRILRREDIPQGRIRSLASSLEPKLAQELVTLKLLLPQDIGNTRFSLSELEHPDRRKQIDLELATKDWDVTVSKLLQNGQIGFVAHLRLSDNAIVYFERISNPYGRSIRVGDRLRVRLQTQLDKKKNRWGYAVKSGVILTGKAEG